MFVGAQRRRSAAGAMLDAEVSAVQITEHTPVADIAASIPSSVRVFEERGVDFCCGGKKPIGSVCEEQGLSFRDMVAAIEASAAMSAPGQRDWTQESLQALVDHIIRTYHDPLRQQLPWLQAIAAKVLEVHGSKSRHLARVEEIVEELSKELIGHMDTEELALFPAICAIEAGGSARLAVAGPIESMERDHDRAGRLLAELRELTDSYSVPEWSCSTFRTLYRELEEVEISMHEHVHLENNVLFPRALQLEAAV
jgi:regulator of cell morphogenesis and NO signaling